MTPVFGLSSNDIVHCDPLILLFKGVSKYSFQYNHSVHFHLVKIENTTVPNTRVGEIFLCLISIISPTRLARRGISKIFNSFTNFFYRVVAQDLRVMGSYSDPMSGHYSELHKFTKFLDFNSILLMLRASLFAKSGNPKF